MLRVKLKLRERILSYFIAIAAVSLLLVNLLWFNSSRNVTLQTTSSQLASAAADAAHQIEGYLELRQLGLVIHSQTKSVLGADREKVTEEFKDFLLQDKDIQDLSLIDHSGRELVHLTRDRLYGSDELIDQSSSPAFKYPFSSGGQHYISSLYFDQQGEPGINISVPIVEPDFPQELERLKVSPEGRTIPPEKIRGVLKANYRLTSLWQKIREVKIGRSGYVFLVDNQGNVLVHPDESLSKTRKNLSNVYEVQHFLDDIHYMRHGAGYKETVAESLNEFGVRSLTSHAPVMPNEWAVIDQVPLSDILFETNQSLTFASVIFVVVLGIFFLSGMLISKQIVRPIEKLKEGSRLISGGNFDYRLEIKTGDEIEDLASEFNTMAETLKKNIEQLTAQNRLLMALRSLDILSLGTTDIKALAEAVVEISHQELGFFASTLALVDQSINGVRRIAISQRDNPKIKEALKILPMKFEEQIVPLTEKENFLVKSIATRKTFYSTSLYDVQRGYLSKETSQRVQEVSGIRSVFVYPLITKSGVIGTLTYHATVERDKISDDAYDLMQAFATEAAQVLENALLYEAIQRDREVISAERNKLALVLSGIKDAVIAVDTKRKIVVFNSGAEKLTGLKSKDVLGKSVSSVLDFYEADKKIEASVYCPIRKDDFEGLVYSGSELKGKTSLGRDFYVNLTAGKISEGQKVDLGCILTLHDISSEKELEEMKLDFVSMAAHELRTPLTAIRGYLAVFMQENLGKFNSEQETYLNRIDISSQQLSSLVDNLLNVSRIEKGELTINIEPTDWVATTRQAVDSFLGQARERKISLEFVEPAEVLPKMKIDKIRMGEVLNNLISNAISYSRAGGHVKVWMEIKTGEVITHIEDDGPGIPPNALPHLFTKFFRVAGKLEQGSKGTGLGLYISKAIVTLHKGRIWADSNFGKGSVFSFALPAQAGLPILKNDS